MGVSIVNDSSRQDNADGRDHKLANKNYDVDLTPPDGFANHNISKVPLSSLEVDILDDPLIFNDADSFSSIDVDNNEDTNNNETGPLLGTEDIDNYMKDNSRRLSKLFAGTHSRRVSISSGSANSPLAKDDNATGDQKNFDTQAYLDKRVMTPLQERWNAVTILPNMFYCIYFVLAGCWLTSDALENARQSAQDGDEIVFPKDQDGWTDMAQDVFGDGNDWLGNIGCINIPMLPNMHALPPLPVVAGAVGIVTHAPFSFIYHWCYATKIHPSKRVEHWSRRLDHAFIHFASACMSYATSGRMDYFLLCAAFNLDCAYRQFERKVKPRRNQIRTGLSILLYCLPVLRRGYYFTFLELVFIFGLSGWFFAAYPVGGWSHSMFHVVVAFMPHLIMVSACKLQSSQLQIGLAAKCAVMAGKA